MDIRTLSDATIILALIGIGVLSVAGFGVWRRYMESLMNNHRVSIELERQKNAAYEESCHAQTRYYDRQTKSEDWE